jgi:type IV pilus assembly protein PilA
MGKSHGFTLIELMIVVTIIGILAALAIPAYMNYLTRAKVSEGLTLSHPIKASIAEYFSSTGAFPADNATLGIGAPATLHGKYVATVEIQAGGLIVVTFGDATLAGQTITLTPTALDRAVQWTCATTLPAALRPKECT